MNGQTDKKQTDGTRLIPLCDGDRCGEHRRHLQLSNEAWPSPAALTLHPVPRVELDPNKRSGKQESMWAVHSRPRKHSEQKGNGKITESQDLKPRSRCCIWTEKRIGYSVLSTKNRTQSTTAHKQLWPHYSRSLSGFVLVVQTLLSYHFLWAPPCGCPAAEINTRPSRPAPSSLTPTTQIPTVSTTHFDILYSIIEPW